MIKKIKIFIFLIISFTILVFFKGISFSQTATPTPTPDNSQAISDLQNKIADLQNKISSLQSQEKTLSSQIAIMDSQITLSEYKIQSTEEQITNLTLDIDTASKKITTLQSSLNDSISALLNRIVATYEVGSIQPLQILLTSGNASDFLTRLNYLRLAQAHDKELIYDTQQAKNDYSNQKTIFENEKKQVEALNLQLQDYNDQLNKQKADKQRLLSETQGSESNYQTLLAQAKAELSGFSNFAVAAGGATLTSFGNGSNGWYYTQRDPQWGNLLLPGSSSSVAVAGCAVTSVAMVCKNYGQNVSPATMVSDPSKFIGGDLWNWAFSCSGKTTSWIGASQDTVRSYVQSGTPVILRLIAPSVSGLHFVVAWKWDGSDFIIHDPYYGPDKKFSDRYNWSQVTTAIAIH